VGEGGSFRYCWLEELRYCSLPYARPFCVFICPCVFWSIIGLVTWFPGILAWMFERERVSGLRVLFFFRIFSLPRLDCKGRGRGKDGGIAPGGLEGDSDGFLFGPGLELRRPVLFVGACVCLGQQLIGSLFGWLLIENNTYFSLRG
jgi:hypothetical protein